MRKLPIRDKKLFLKYAIPCGSVLRDRGKVSQKELDSLKRSVLEGRPVKKDVGKIFNVARIMCSITALKMHREEINQDVIRRYFWGEHNEVAEWRASVFRDFDPEECRVRPARVLSAGKTITVETPEGRRKVSESFCPVRKGDWVIMHYSHIIEKVAEREARRLW